MCLSTIINHKSRWIKAKLNLLCASGFTLFNLLQHFCKYNLQHRFSLTTKSICVRVNKTHCHCHTCGCFLFPFCNMDFFLFAVCLYMLCVSNHPSSGDVCSRCIKALEHTAVPSSREPKRVLWQLNEDITHVALWFKWCRHSLIQGSVFGPDYCTWPMKQSGTAHTCECIHAAKANNMSFSVISFYRVFVICRASKAPQTTAPEMTWVNISDLHFKM